MPGHATPRSYLYVLNYLAGPQLYVVYVEYVQLATMIMIMIMITENTVNYTNWYVQEWKEKLQIIQESQL